MTTPTHIKDIDATALWKKSCTMRGDRAEPGILFWDTIIRESVPDCYADLGYQTISTNPCGEIPSVHMIHAGCWRLIFLYVENPFHRRLNLTGSFSKKHIAAAQRMMDDIIDLELEKSRCYPAKKSMKTRKKPK